jgi:hypothetical protein
MGIDHTHRVHIGEEEKKGECTYLPYQLERTSTPTLLLMVDRVKGGRVFTFPPPHQAGLILLS